MPGGKRRTSIAAMPRPARAVWDAVCGGAFFTRWTALVGVLVAGLLSIPTVGDTSIGGALRGVAVALVGLLPLIAVCAVAAALERTLHAPAARAAVVLAALAAASIARTFVNDAVSVWMWSVPTEGAFGPRIAANLLLGVLVLPVVAVTVRRYRAMRATNARLARALARLDEGLSRARAFDAEVRITLGERVAALRARRAVLLAAPLTFHAVSDYAAQVRAASHDLDALARTELLTGVVTGPIRHGRRAPSPWLARLAPTPWLVAGALYALLCAPYALAAGGPVAGPLAAALPVAADVAVGWMLRRGAPATAERAAASPWARSGAGRRAEAVARGRRFVRAWGVAGLCCALGALALIPSIGWLCVVSAVGVPLTAVVVAASTDVARRTREGEQRYAERLAEGTLALAEASARVREPLRRAVDLLHGRVQGRCVILAAHVDEHEATDADVAAFVDATDAAFAAVLCGAGMGDADRAGTAPGDAEREGLVELLDAWRATVAVEVVSEAGEPLAHGAPWSADVAAALAVGDVTQRVARVVNEALVNAVKHSTARRARLRLMLVPAGPDMPEGWMELRVRVASAGRLERGRRAGLGVGDERAWTVQDGADVVMEARIPVPAAAPAAVQPAPAVLDALG